LYFFGFGFEKVSIFFSFKEKKNKLFEIHIFQRNKLFFKIKKINDKAK